jgi:hypothetical protein
MEVPAPTLAALLIKIEIAAVSLDDDHGQAMLSDAQRLLRLGVRANRLRAGLNRSAPWWRDFPNPSRVLWSLRRRLNMAAIQGDTVEVLAQVQRIVEAIVPDARCELQDYEHRIGCGALDGSGKLRDVRVMRAGLTEEDARNMGQTLADRLAGIRTYRPHRQRRQV